MPPAVRSRFNTPMIGVHWLTAALIGLAYGSSWLQEAFEDGPMEAVLQGWHTTFGIAVFGLVALRLVLRAASRTPAITPAPPAWQATLATLMHVALYGLMIAQPLTGWLLTNADGHAVVWFGYPLPALIGPSERLEDLLEDVHEAIANAGYVLIGLHTAAALFHHYVVRDNTLARMLPVLSRPAPR